MEKGALTALAGTKRALPKDPPQACPLYQFASAVRLAETLRVLNSSA